MKKIDSSLVDFLTTVTTDFIGLIGKIEQMKDNMAQLKRESEVSKSELHKAQLASNTRSSQPKFHAAINEEDDDQEENQEQDWKAKNLISHVSPD